MPFKCIHLQNILLTANFPSDVQWMQCDRSIDLSLFTCMFADTPPHFINWMSSVQSSKDLMSPHIASHSTHTNWIYICIEHICVWSKHSIYSNMFITNDCLYSFRLVYAIEWNFYRHTIHSLYFFIFLFFIRIVSLFWFTSCN